MEGRFMEKHFFNHSAASWLVLFTFSFSFCFGEIQIDANFPGGNILVDSIHEGVVRVRPDLRDSNDWFYYAFRVRGAEGETLKFVFDAPNRVGSRGPAISTDEGKTWRYLSSTPNFDSQKFTYSFLEDETSVIFATAILYTQRNWDEFIADYRNHPSVKLGVLTQSRKGREVEVVQIGAGNPGAKFAVALTCRHHSCEMTASFLLEGIIQEILSETPEGKWLRENAEFFIVPFVDKDGVEDGDQGKGRRPHDHNRDYHHEIYPEIRALKAEIERKFSGKPLFFMDLHCPWIRSGMNEYLYSPMSPSEEMTKASKEFFAILEELQKEGEIPYRESWNLPFGKDWNTGRNYVKQENGIPTAGSKMWAMELPNIIFAGTIEIPYSNSSGVEVTPRNARELGRNTARSIERFLRKTVRKEK